MTALAAEHVVDLSRDLPLTLHEAGSGPTILLLHGGAGPERLSSVVEHFLHTHHMLAPTHPGWNGTPRPDRLNSVASLAAAYLDLLAQRGLQDVSVLGSSFGGWIAAQMAIQDTASRAYARAIPGATFTLIEGAGHLPTSQAPEPTFTVVDEFLTSNLASAADAS